MHSEIFQNPLVPLDFTSSNFLFNGKRKIQNQWFLIFFILNFLSFLIYNFFDFELSGLLSNVISPMKAFLKDISLQTGISFVFFVIFFIFVIFFPSLFILLSYLFVILLILIMFVIFSLTCSPFAIIAIVFGLVLLFLVLKDPNEISRSGSVVAHSISLLWQYPSSFLFVFLILGITCFVNEILSNLFSTITPEKMINYAQISLIIFSFWFNTSLLYLCFYVFSGLAVIHVGIENIDEFPEHPLLFFIKNAFTKSLGSIIKIGIFAPIIWVLRFSSPKENCFFQKIEKICKFFVGEMCEQGLVFSSSFGLSLEEGGLCYWKLTLETEIDQLLDNFCYRLPAVINAFGIGYAPGFIGLLLEAIVTKKINFVILKANFFTKLALFSIRILNYLIFGIATSLNILYVGRRDDLNRIMPDLISQIDQKV